MATSIEVDKACFRLAHMPAPRGWTKESLILGYTDSLEGVASDVAVRVIDRFLKGGYEPSEVNPNFAPSPPALAVLCRKASPKQQERQMGRLYSFRRPNSDILENDIKREDARHLVQNGMYPKGSIWCPGDLDAPQFGTLFAPDLGWHPAEPILSKEEAKDAEAEEAERRRETKDIGILPEERNAIGFKLAGKFMDARASDRPGWFQRVTERQVRELVNAYRNRRA